MDNVFQLYESLNNDKEIQRFVYFLFDEEKFSN